LTTCLRADAGAWCNYPFLTQKERDNETGLDYFLARYYSSTSGRFTSPDPIFISDKQTYNPQLWNLYNYVGNNPLNATDPTGMKLVRLGQHTDEWIDNRSKQINQQLNDPKSKLTNSQRAKLGDELDTITQEKQGNAVAREAIRQLNAIGEGTRLQVSDFTLSTDTANDFMSDPRFVAGDRAAAQREANDADKNSHKRRIRGTKAPPDLLNGEKSALAELLTVSK
jgi:RHS repeat-associated protein